MSGEKGEGAPSGIVIAGFAFAFLFPIVGLILSILGIGRANEPRVGKIIAIIGTIISILNIIAAMALTIYYWDTIVEAIRFIRRMQV